jgi:GT2 family glycosyltransferase
MAQEAYAAKNMIVRHGGETIAESRNGAAGSAQCDWLCFLDADDELAPGFLGAMQRALEQNPSDGKVLLTPAVQQIRKGRPGKPFFFPECTFDTGNWLVIGTLISRDLFHQIGGFREHPHGLEDWNLWARAVRAGARVVKVPDAVYRAHINPKSKHHMLSRRRDEYMIAYHAAQADVL